MNQDDLIGPFTLDADAEVNALKAQLAQAHEAYRVVNEARVLVEQQYTALVQENATLRQRVGELEKQVTWYQQNEWTILQKLDGLERALDRLPKVEGGREIRVIESPSITPQNTEYYYCVEADLDEGQTWDLGTFDTYEEAEAYAALLQARKELGG